MRRALTLLLVVSAVLLATTGPASAHASLVKATPADRASLTKAPTQVSLTFDENIRDESVVIVRGPDGRRASRGAAKVVDGTVRTDVAVRYAGRYTVSYRVVSADGHPVSGTLSFGFHGKGAPTAPKTERTSSASTSSTPWVVGGVAVVVVVGAVLLIVGRRPRRSTEDAGGGSTR